jgi:hypothetical protein
MHIFLDFEASSLSKQSYPIEVGWVLEDGTGEGYLIRPASTWTEWDDSAQAIHGITQEQLERDGTAHDAVCARLVEVFEGNTVYASAPSWDGHWLSMLLRAAGRPRHLLRLKDSQQAFDAAAGGSADRIADARKAVAGRPVAHRAVDDARREWEIWRALSK